LPKTRTDTMRVAETTIELFRSEWIAIRTQE
jgi:hypothetical protein